MQPSDSQQSIGKEQPVVTLTSTDTAEGTPISQVRVLIIDFVLN